MTLNYMKPWNFSCSNVKYILNEKIMDVIDEVCFDKFHKENKKPKALHASKLMEYCLPTSQGLSDSKQNQSAQKLSRMNHFTFI